MTDLADFDGCRRKCCQTGKHTLTWGECEHAPAPEPTVNLSKIFKGADGHLSIGYASYTVKQLAEEVIEPALRASGVEVSADRFPDLACIAAHAIVHRNEEPFEETLRLNRLQTCGKCGAGYEVGTECSTCAFQVRMDTETRTHGADRHGPKMGCIKCRCTSTTGHDANKEMSE